MDDPMQTTPLGADAITRYYSQDEVNAMMHVARHQLDALTNLLIALVRRSGGSAFVKQDEIDALENCVLRTVQTSGPDGVQLMVRREAALRG